MHTHILDNYYFNSLLLCLQQLIQETVCQLNLSLPLVLATNCCLLFGIAHAIDFEQHFRLIESVVSD